MDVVTVALTGHEILSLCQLTAWAVRFLKKTVLMSQEEAKNHDAESPSDCKQTNQ